jgi:hypothetical protein
VTATPEKIQTAMSHLRSADMTAPNCKFTASSLDA